MHPEFPIECRCWHRQERFQLAFARQAMEVLPRREDTAFKPGARGLILLAETEMALERPLRVLKEVYGNDLGIDPPAIRYHQADRLEEPYMGLRVLCAPQYFEAVRQELQLRAATIMDAEVTRSFGIVRACAPQATLFGFPDRLTQLTRGQGKLVMWLSHYAPVQEPPPDGSAA